jgi:Tyrosyl-tRNA synthetase
LEGDESMPVNFLAASGLIKSKSEAKRLVSSNALSVNDEKYTDPYASLAKGEYTIKCGKKGFLLLTVK